MGFRSRQHCKASESKLMPYQPIRELSAKLERGRIVWAVNGAPLLGDTLRTFSRMEVQWTNGNRLHHAVSLVNVGNMSHVGHTEYSLDILLHIKFHGVRAELSLFRNPEIRRCVTAIKWSKTDGN